MTLTRTGVLKLSAAMAGCLGDLRLIFETAMGKARQAVELMTEEIVRIEVILRTARREEPQFGFTPFRAGSIPACKN